MLRYYFEERPNKILYSVPNDLGVVNKNCKRNVQGRETIIIVHEK